MSTGDKYRCPDCGVSVVVGVTLEDPPTHKCSKHANKVRELEHVGRASLSST